MRNKPKNPFPWPSLAVIVLLVVSQVFLDLRLPQYMAGITDALQAGTATPEFLLGVGRAMLFVTAGSFLCSVLAGLLTARVSLSYVRGLRMRLFSRIQDFTHAETSRFTIPGLVTRATNDLSQIQWFIAQALRLESRRQFSPFGLFDGYLP